MSKKIFYGFLYRVLFFANFFDILITNFRFTDTKLYTTPLQEHAHISMLTLHRCDNSQSWVKNGEKKNQKIAISVKNPPYKHLKKYGSFSEFRTSTEKSVMLATLNRTDERQNVQRRYFRNAKPVPRIKIRRKILPQIE